MGKGLAAGLIACLLQPNLAAAQVLTGALIGTVRDEQGGVLPGANVRLTSPALIGGALTQITDPRGELRFPALAPGPYAIEIDLDGFAPLREDGIAIGAGATIERTVILKLAGVAESVIVEGRGSRIEARDPGFGSRFGVEDIHAIPTRRTSMFDWIRTAPGISPTSPSSGTSTTISAFGSGTNENQFLFDGTNFTCPCIGIARAEPGIDFIQEVQVQSVGASAEFGSVQGAVINVITRQGGDRVQADASYYTQTAGLTSQPIELPLARPRTSTSGYERVRYRDLTANVGGPLRRDRLWYFAGYQYLRDYDSQPGTDPTFPRAYEQNKVFAKLTWRLTPGLQLMQSLHDEHWVNPDRPTLVTPFVATTRAHATVPAITFGHLTHTLSSNTVWDARVGRFDYTQENPPSSGIFTVTSRSDRVSGVTSGAPPQFGAMLIARTTAKATLSRYQPRLAGADHQAKIGVQVERGEHHLTTLTPTGVRYVDDARDPNFPQAIARDPSVEGGLSITSSAFASDAIIVGSRLTINAGVRFDHAAAISQDLHAIDAQGNETDGMVRGLGSLYTWNIVSPRLGITAKLTADGRTMLRASYGRFSQGVLTGEFGPFHPGVTPTTTTAFDPSTGGYTRLISVVDSKINLRLDGDTGAPHSDEYSVGVDGEIGGRLALSVAYVGKVGGSFIGWTDVGGQYQGDSRALVDGRRVPVLVLTNGTAGRRFLLTNIADYSLRYNGLVVVAEKRRAHGWHAFGSYTYSRASGLQASSGATAAAAQTSTVAPNATFGRDPNDLTNADGRLPNDRPHVFRAMGSLDIPHMGITLAADLQQVSGKPWAASALVVLPQGDQRMLLEPRGSRRLSSQSILDVRVSKPIAFGHRGRAELTLDVLNALNDTAEEALATDNFFSPSFGQGTVFVDPRRAMLGVRINLPH